MILPQDYEDSRSINPMARVGPSTEPEEASPEQQAAWEAEKAEKKRTKKARQRAARAQAAAPHQCSQAEVGPDHDHLHMPSGGLTGMHRIYVNHPVVSILQLWLHHHQYTQAHGQANHLESTFCPDIPSAPAQQVAKSALCLQMYKKWLDTPIVPSCDSDQHCSCRPRAWASPLQNVTPTVQRQQCQQIQEALRQSLQAMGVAGAWGHQQVQEPALLSMLQSHRKPSQICLSQSYAWGLPTMVRAHLQTRPSRGAKCNQVQQLTG